MKESNRPSGGLVDKRDLRTGDILHCNGRRLLSKLIRKVSRGEYSHTATVVVAYGQVLIVEAQRRGVDIMPYDAWQEKYGYEYDVARPIRLNHTTKHARRAFRPAGVAKYDIGMLLWDYPRYVLTGKWRGADEDEAISENRYTCSTYVGWLFKMENWWKLSPQQVYENTVISDEYIFI